MDSFNIQELNRILYSSLELDREITSQETASFNTAKSELLDAFKNHPVTQEIASGPDASNTSGTLGGVGNLFSFIGFPAGSSPIDDVRNILETKLTLGSAAKNTVAAGGLEFKFSIYVPIDEIYQATPLPFETGNSWVAGIEHGISGFSNFLYVAAKASRSGKGIETKNTVRGTDFQPTPYLLSMIGDFVRKLNGNSSFTFE